ncbi:MAG: PilW family protein [Variovorax sp.]
MAIGLVVLGAMIAIYLSTSASSRQSSAISLLNEDGAIALSIIGSQVRMAGFSLPRRDPSNASATVGGVQVSVADRNFTGAGIRGCDNGFSNPLNASFDGLTCSNDATRPAAFAVRFEGADGKTPIDPSAALLPPATDCRNQSVARNEPGLETDYPLVESRYELRASGGTPELGCRGNGKTFEYQALTSNVEDMTVTYGVAADGVSSDVQADVDAATIEGFGGSVDQRWSRVVAVKVCLLMRTEQPQADANTPYIDCKGEPQPSDDRRLRKAYSATFTLRNRSGFASTP